MRKPRAARSPAPAGPPTRLVRSPRVTLAFISVMGLLLWGRLLLKEVPQTASAVDAAMAAAAVERTAPAPAPATPTVGAAARNLEKAPEKEAPAGKVGR